MEKTRVGSYRLVPRLVLTVLFCHLGGLGCISTGPIVLQDRRTVLEEQAGGSFPKLEEELASSAVTAKPVPLTRGQLEGSGERPESLAIAESKGDTAAEAGDADRIDQYLQRRCIGEALDGTLVETADTCQGTVDKAKVVRLLERQNRNRWQIWRDLQGRRPQVSFPEIVRIWREFHLQSVVCGANVQKADKSFEARPCG